MRQDGRAGGGRWGNLVEGLRKAKTTATQHHAQGDAASDEEMQALGVEDPDMDRSIKHLTRKWQGEVKGRLIVRVVHARGLAAADSRVFRRGSSDPYVVLTLREASGCCSRRKTHTCPRTLDPKWHQQFTFSVRNEADGMTLAVEVWDEDPRNTQDNFLGQAEVLLNVGSLPLDWQRHTLSLEPRSHSQTRGKQAGPLSMFSNIQALSSGKDVKVKGEISIAIGYERWKTKGLVDRFRAVMNSAKAMSMMAAFFIVFAGFVLLVTTQARILCTGLALSNCKEKPVDSAKVSTACAAVCSLLCGAIHLMGSMNWLGVEWNCNYLTIMDLLEDPDEQEYRNTLDDAENLLGISFEMTPQSRGRAHIALGAALGSIFKIKRPILLLRLIAWCSHFLACVLLVLALLLIWVEATPQPYGDILAEGVYLVAFSLVTIWMSAGMLVRAGRDLMEEQKWKRDKTWNALMRQRSGKRRQMRQMIHNSHNKLQPLLQINPTS